MRTGLKRRKIGSITFRAKAAKPAKIKGLSPAVIVHVLCGTRKMFATRAGAVRGISLEKDISAMQISRT
jgi:hypothetical protein